MIQNPFLRRELAWWWRPERRYWVTIYPLLLIAFPFILCGLLDPLLGIDASLDAAWMGAFCLWFLALSLGAVLLGASAWPRERNLGTLTALVAAGYNPLREMRGRFGAAMLVLLPAWIVGGILIGVTPPVFLDSVPAGPMGEVVALWLFCPVWCAVWVALSLRCSLESRTQLQAMIWLVGATVALLFFNAIASAVPRFFVCVAVYSSACVCSSAVPWRFDLAPLANAFYLPGSLPGSPFAFMIAGAPLWLYVPILLLWGMFAHAVLKSAARRLAQEEPLHTEDFPLLRLFRQLVPTGQAAVYRDGISLLDENPALEVAQRPRARGIVDRLLSPFHSNPFYAAYRNGFLRLHCGVSAAPGSAWPPALMFYGIITYCMFAWHGLYEFGLYMLLSGLLPALAISVVEAFALGAQSLTAEREQSTWPLLVVTGMDAAVVLRGKFAAAFYAISGEWMVGCGMWLLALVTPTPAMALLMLVQPLLVAAAILAGLAWASHPVERRAGGNHFWAILGGAVLVCGLYGVAVSFADTALTLGRQCTAWLDPLLTMSLLSNPQHELDGILRLLVGMALCLWLIATTWWLARWRLGRIMG